MRIHEVGLFLISAVCMVYAIPSKEAVSKRQSAVGARERARYRIVYPVACPLADASVVFSP